MFGKFFFSYMRAVVIFVVVLILNQTKSVGAHVRVVWVVFHFRCVYPLLIFSTHQIKSKIVCSSLEPPLKLRAKYEYKIMDSTIQSTGHNFLSRECEIHLFGSCSYIFTLPTIFTLYVNGCCGVPI